MKVPTYLAVFSNRRFDAVVAPTSSGGGHSASTMCSPSAWVPSCANVVPNDAFAAPLSRLRSEQGLYREATSAVAARADAVSRPCTPAEVPIRNYDVEIKLFSDGALVTHRNRIRNRRGCSFEQFVATARLVLRCWS